MNRAILGEGGTVMQYVGDAVMAVFGAPRPYDRPRRPGARRGACDARRAGAVNAEWATEGWTPFGLGIGRVDRRRSPRPCSAREERLEYTVVGDAVNLCQRLQQFAGRRRDVLSEATWDALTSSPPAERTGRASGQGPRARRFVHARLHRSTDLPPVRRRPGGNVMTISETTLDSQPVGSRRSS